MTLIMASEKMYTARAIVMASSSLLVLKRKIDTKAPMNEGRKYKFIPDELKDPIMIARKAPSKPASRSFIVGAAMGMGISRLLLIVAPQLGQYSAPFGRGNPHFSQFAT